MDDQRKVLVSQNAPSVLVSQKWRVGEVLKWGESENSFTLARDLMQPIYSQEDDGSLSLASNLSGQENDAKNVVLQLHTPLTNAQGRFNGVIMAEYAVESLLRYGVPSEISAKYAVSLLDSDGNLVAGQSIPKRSQAWRVMPGISPQNNEYEVPVSQGSGIADFTRPCWQWHVLDHRLTELAYGMDADCQLAAYPQATTNSKRINC